MVDQITGGASGQTTEPFSAFRFFQFFQFFLWFPIVKWGRIQPFLAPLLKHRPVVAGEDFTDFLTDC